MSTDNGVLHDNDAVIWDTFPTMAKASDDDDDDDAGGKATFTDAGPKDGAISGVASGRSRLRACGIIFPKLLTLLALWISADRLERAVWSFTVITSSYLALQTVAFTASISGRTVLVSVSYMALLASTVAHLSSATGIFIMLIDTAYAAGLCGYALSDHRQRHGADRSAEHIIPPPRSEEEIKHDGDAFIVLCFYASVVSLASAAGAAVALYFMVDVYWLVVVLVMLIDLSLFSWLALVVLNLVQDVLLTCHQLPLVYWGCVFLLVPDYFVSLLFGQGIGVLVHVSGMIFLAGFLGYHLGIYNHYYKRRMENGEKKVV
ncbi:hypothetical protein QOZ80_9BG0695020 [Eleusine coracana subsp. coracana]|nr:hypothetical protein QOZ80_9BG0695020 [Eleusine coracana subsp. coracana]